MSIGYACIAVGVANTGMKHCLIKNASQTKLCDLITSNLESLDTIINYNIKQGIKLFRISSDLIPFGSHPANTIRWWELYEQKLESIGEKIKNSKMRVSMHPGQYTVLNSPNNEVVDRAIKDLEYHSKVLDCLNTGSDNKIILHIGGVYGDKAPSIERFISNYQRLSDSVKNRLVIENDDKSYHISDVLGISQLLEIPVIFDNLHHEVNPPNLDEPINYWIAQCNLTWKKKDGNQKIHYSQQNHEKKPGSHSESINSSEFMDFYGNLLKQDIDIMLEVKDKNLSAIKCINCTLDTKTIIDLEREWSKYKYNVLEKSQVKYTQIRKLLKDKTSYPVLDFYCILEDALGQPETMGNAVNGVQHVWGYFKDKASAKEKAKIQKLTQTYLNGETNLQTIKKFLWTLAVKYEEKYLLNSYYFIL